MTDPQPSPFTSLLKSNAIPLDDEVSSVKQYIQECQKDTAVLDEALETLQLKRDALKAKMDQHWGLIHPLRRNPDILREIFVHCLPAEHDSVVSPRELPLLLTGVCHYWRDLALTTPRLWASIHIAIPATPRAVDLSGASLEPVSDFRRDALLEVITVWLSRSGSCPLSISIYDPRFGGGAIKESLPFFNAVVLHSSRWRKLTLNGEGAALAKFDELEASQVPLLEEVDLNIYSIGAQLMGLQPGGTISHHPSWTRFGLLTAPTIRKLKLSIKPNEIPLLWTNLFHISIGIISGAQIDSQDSLQILRLCPNLTTARFQIQHNTLVHDHPLPFISNRLKQLTLYFFRSEPGAFIFFNTLRTPALQSLTVHGYEPSTEIGLEPFLKFVRQVNSVQRLCISARFESKQLEAVLCECPDLTSLKTIGQSPFGMAHQQTSQPIGVMKSTLRALSPREPGQDYMCPKLTTLEVDQANFSLEALVEFVLAKERISMSGDGSKIKYLNIVYNSQFEDLVVQKLPEALKSGIHSRKIPDRNPYVCRQGLQMSRY
ncbi:hypothetical protein CPB83DRAFT_844497 [Crepidotus variabilis]|uniref:F-box domain-containing protein n=1 Tax=Crepidotus variabilis TaxID=179855 RepID=A0A9P6EPS8_9AGAR|nr:hypothetical protein CPB83DRAFT_844497 [Crepidotus variabilis]